MGRRTNNWIWTLVETVGLRTLFSIIIGVPAMIAFIVPIWHCLSSNEKIIAGVLGAVILFAIIFVVYDQTRKRLYVIPKILYQMHLRVMEIASRLSAEMLTKEDGADLISLIGIDAKQLFSSFKDLDSLLSSVPELVRTAETRFEEVKAEGETPLRLCYLLYERIGLKQALETDEPYKQLGQSLDRIQPSVPTVEITEAVLEYGKISRIFCSILPLLHMRHRLIEQMLPLQYKIDRVRYVERINDTMAKLLAKVRESIDRYYKGK